MRSNLDWWQWALPLLATAAILFVLAVVGEKRRRMIGDACHGILSGKGNTRSARITKFLVIVVMTLMAATALLKLFRSLLP